MLSSIGNAKSCELILCSMDIYMSIVIIKIISRDERQLSTIFQTIYLLECHYEETQRMQNLSDHLDAIRL